MPKHYGKHQREAAKQFLRDAILCNRQHGEYSCYSIYEKEGERWIEVEPNIPELPHSEYSLEVMEEL